MADAGLDGGTSLRPTFAITFDTELVWGSFDRVSTTEFERRHPAVRDTIAAILRLLERYEIPATWAIVGHLFLAECARGANGLAHPDLARPCQSGRRADWYDDDPCTDRRRDPLWYGDDIVDAVMAARPGHEVACHSFGHPLYGDRCMTPAAVAAELEACQALAATRGLVLKSFVFPQSSEGHHDVLRAHGFRAYRGADPTWFSRWPSAIRRPAHFVDQLAGLAPPVSQPYERLPGLWNIPGSTLVIGRGGVRRLISNESRVRKFRAGIDAARREGGVFHLWTHPCNLADGTSALLDGLERMLREAAEARGRGEIVIETMAQIADHMTAATAAARS